jgi:tRNA-dihydrouridine synthase A
MKAAFPALHISINGGIPNLEAAEAPLARGIDGAMLGRAAYHDPAVLLGADERIFGLPGGQTRETALAAMLPHIEAHLAAGGRLGDITRHMLGLYSGRPGARAWRRRLSEAAGQRGGPELVEAAAAEVLRAA